jgi:hypothetical protein
MVRIGSVRLELRASRAEEPKGAAQGPNLELSYARALETRFPELQKLGLCLHERTSTEILDFYVNYLPLVHQPSHRAHLRSLLCRMRTRTKDPALQAAAMRAIAVSDLSDGMPDRALCLRRDPVMSAEWEAQTRDLEAHYGAPLVSEDWSQSSRGKSLVAYFEAHESLLRTKDILHFGPERELFSWMRARQSALDIHRYFTVDGIQPQFDKLHDITDIRIPDQSFDVVICHRVMEHVCDDAKGFSELFRVLRPGGLLNFSVPQAPHRATTADWFIPDESHHGHVRHYGRDLEQRMSDAGFHVTLESWLLKQPLNMLRARGAYPLRMYNAWR